ncbi:MAG: zinc-binding dehydrogenase [Rhodospirillaceae bacterium]
MLGSSRSNFKAAVLTELKSDLVIEDIELPGTLEVGQVLVKLRYSGICGSQIGEIDGVKGPDRWLPHLLGHEGAGYVEQIGPGVTTVAAGDAVVLHWRPSLGIQATPAKYSANGKKVNAGWVTTFNELAIVSENRLTVIPNTIDMKIAALYGCAVTTGFGVIDNKSGIKLGQSVVVFGAGGIGLNIVQGAALAGAKKIIAVDRYSNRLDLAKKCGATHTIDGSKQDPWQQIEAALSADQLDIFIDNTGNTEVVGRGYNIIGPHGRVVLVGVPKAGDQALLYTLPLHFGKSITGSHGGEAIPHEDIPRYMGLTESKGIDLNDIITEVAPLIEINDLIRMMRSGESAGRCLVDFDL